MADKDLIIRERLDDSGIFDFPGVYSYMHSHLRDQENYGVTEEKYSEKVSGNSRDIDIEWKASKGISDYFKIEINIKFEIRGLVDVEVEIDGSKKKMNKGKITIDFKGILVRDPESKWESKPFYKFIKDYYNKYIIPSRIEDMKQKVISDVVELKESIKAFLDLTGSRKGGR